MVKVPDMAPNSQPYCREHLQRRADWLRQQGGAAGVPWRLVLSRWGGGAERIVRSSRGESAEVCMYTGARRTVVISPAGSHSST